MGIFDRLFGKASPENTSADHFYVQADGQVMTALSKEWKWLIGDGMRPLRFTACGDVFLSDTRGAVYWLRTVEGQLEKVATSQAEFQSKLQQSEFRETVLQVSTVNQLRAMLGALPPGKCYGLKLLPVLGGNYNFENYVHMRLAEHIGFTGNVRFQVKDLPPGATIQVKMVD
ncbi:MAG TPA: DUF1851 domain-containing protein [Acidobacteriota bacterium]|nr:DUF1851 domain-containing protein [Acidobacteriota bacterium]